MSGKSKKSMLIMALIAIVIGVVSSYLTISDKYVFSHNFNKYLQQVSGKPMSIRNELKVTYDNKNFIVLLSTPVDQRCELYATCFEDKFGGLLYKPTYGAMQGESKSLYGMIVNFTQDGSDNRFYVVYGYNKDFKAGSYEVKQVKSNAFVKEDISQQEYFLQTFKDIVYAYVIFKDLDNNDISNLFITGN
jgi:hypothetical protein